MESNNKRRNDGRSLQGRRSFSSSVTQFVAVGGRLAAAAAELFMPKTEVTAQCIQIASAGRGYVCASKPKTQSAVSGLVVIEA